MSTAPAPTNPPAPAGLPTLSITIGAKAHSIPFDFSRLDAIERSLGVAVNEFVFGELAALVQGVDQKSDAGKREISRRFMTKLSMHRVIRVLAGVFDVGVDQLPTVVPMKEAWGVFNHVAPVLMQACRDFYGIEVDGGADAAEEKPANPTAASGTSEPSSASNSG